MSNPLMGMMGMMGDGNGGMFARIRQFAGLIGKRDPKQMVMTLAKQKGMSEQDINDALQQAQYIARGMGVR